MQIAEYESSSMVEKLCKTLGCLGFETLDLSSESYQNNLGKGYAIRTRKHKKMQCYSFNWVKLGRRPTP